MYEDKFRKAMCKVQNSNKSGRQSKSYAIDFKLTNLNTLIKIGTIISSRGLSYCPSPFFIIYHLHANDDLRELLLFFSALKLSIFKRNVT